MTVLTVSRIFFISYCSTANPSGQAEQANQVKVKYFVVFGTNETFFLRLKFSATRQARVKPTLQSRKLSLHAAMSKNNPIPNVLEKGRFAVQRNWICGL